MKFHTINYIFTLFALFVFLTNSYTFSDTLYLKNGGTVEGIIKEEGDYYVVTLSYGNASFHKNEVAEVKYSSEVERKKTKSEWDKERTRQRLKEAARKATKVKKTAPAAKQPKYMEIGKQGERVDIARYVVKGKITIFDFYSPYCGPCKKVGPRLEGLAHSRDDIVVRKVNINRRNVRGIDWKSPVARQYNIKYVPYFKVYNERGNLWLEGKPASNKVHGWLK